MAGIYDNFFDTGGAPSPAPAPSPTPAPTPSGGGGFDNFFDTAPQNAPQPSPAVDKAVDSVGKSANLSPEVPPTSDLVTGAASRLGETPDEFTKQINDADPFSKFAIKVLPNLVSGIVNFAKGFFHPSVYNTKLTPDQQKQYVKTGKVDFTDQQKDPVGATADKISKDASDFNKITGTGKFTAAIGQGVGNTLPQLPIFWAGGELAEGSSIPQLLSGFAKEVPGIGKFLAPFLENGVKTLGGFSLADQPGSSNHFKTFVDDLKKSAIFSTPALLESKILSTGGIAALTYLSAKMNGADTATSGASALLMGLVHGANVFGTGTVEDFATKTKNDAFDTLNKFSDTKIDANSSPEDIKAAYKEAIFKSHPDKGGNQADAAKVNAAYKLLSSGVADTVKSQPAEQPAPDMTPKNLGEISGNATTENSLVPREEAITEPSNASEKPGASNIVTTPDLRTFDFHEMEGQPQTDEANAKIHDQIVNHPDQPMVPGGESFDAAAKRGLAKVNEILSKGETAAITTHNSMFGLIKLWNEYGRPTTLTQRFRQDYVKQDNSHPTGDSYVIKGDKGDVHLLRHGETTDNAKKVFRTATAQLTDQGRQEASDLGEKLKDSGITKIYSSDLPRAVETSNIVMSKISPEKSETKPVSTKKPQEEPKKPEEKVSTAQGRKEAVTKPVGTGETKISSMADSIEKILPDFVSEKDLEYQKTSHAEQAKLASDFIKNFPERALRIAEGRENPPEGILKNAISIALSQELLKNGQEQEAANVIKDMRQQSTRFGQEVEILKTVSDPNSFEYWISRLTDDKIEQLSQPLVYQAKASGKKVSREGALSQKVDSDIKEIHQTLTKEQLKIDEAQKIIDSFTC